MATATGNTPDNNTRGVSRSKSRIFLLTINPESLKHYDEIKSYFDGLKSCNYYIVTEHHGQKLQHYHLAAQFKNATALSVKKLFGAHIKAGKYGNIQDMVRYCKCEDDKHKKLGVTATIIDEYGEMKIGNRFPTIKEVKQMKREERDELPIQYQRTVEAINENEDEEQGFMNMLDEIERDELKAPEIIYILGESGNGKTYGAYKLALKSYQKQDIGRITINNNFCSITNKSAKCFVIEEFRPSQIAAADFLQLTDKYGYNCNIKGGHQFLRPEMIIICSVVKPTKIYKDEMNKQFTRRITKFYEAVNKELKEIKLEDVDKDEDNIIEESLKF